MFITIYEQINEELEVPSPVFTNLIKLAVINSFSVVSAKSVFLLHLRSSFKQFCMTGISMLKKNKKIFLQCLLIFQISCKRWNSFYINHVESISEVSLITTGKEFIPVTMLVILTCTMFLFMIVIRQCKLWRTLFKCELLK